MKTVNPFCVKQAVYRRISVWQVSGAPNEDIVQNHLT